MAGRKKPPHENTKGQASSIFRSFKFTVTFSRTEFSVDSYIALCLCSTKTLRSKQKPFVSSKENILLSGEGGTTPPHSPGNIGIPSQ